MQNNLIKLIAREVDLDFSKVEVTIKLLDDGNTIPFIARYRKEMTGKMDEKQIRKVAERIEYLRKLEKRKEEVINLIDEQDKLNLELEEKIRAATILQEVEDFYRPYRRKRRTRATKAREKGLKPVAEKIWQQDIDKQQLEKMVKEYISPEKELNSVEDIYQGARDIIAEWIADNAEYRKQIRNMTYTSGWITSALRPDLTDEEGKYKDYYDYEEKIADIPAHRIMAINRGEADEILKVKVRAPVKEIINFLQEQIINENNICRNQLQMVIEDAYKRLLGPAVARDVRSSLTERAEEHALNVFGTNLRSLLLQPPLLNRKILGIDPAYRTGCKMAAVNQRGELLTTATIFPHPPRQQREEARRICREIVNKFELDSVAIGNGTASRETELMIAELIEEGLEVDYIIVNEAGASVYSASRLAAEELPELDVVMRGAVSIARRLQDPLAELVKINPRSLGVGLYQHDINQDKLQASLQTVVESAVNYVGVDVNTASPALLQYVAGINSSVASNIVQYREKNGGFTSRKELKDVYGLGPKTFTQAAGFIRIFSSQDPLAQTPIHPESYRETEDLVRELGYKIEDIENSEQLLELRQDLDRINIQHQAEKLGMGVPTLTDIIRALKQPGRDPRQELPGPVFRTDVLKLEDLEVGMILNGTVRNVVDFGVFVDIGVKEDGLVHISEMSHDYIEDPADIAGVGDRVQVKILGVDSQRKRISLSLKL